MPEMLGRVAGVFDSMQAKHRVMLEALRGGWTPDSDATSIEGMDRDGAASRRCCAIARAHDDAGSRCRSRWRSRRPRTPRAPSRRWDPGVRRHPQPADAQASRACRWCGARRAFEASAIDTLRRRIGRRSSAPILRTLFARSTEPTGVRALASVGSELEALEKGWHLSRKGAGPLSGAGGAGAGASSLKGVKLSQKGASPIGGAFWRQGGYRKATCAAASAIASAAAQPARRVLLISTDPAHSLADALGVPLTDSPRRLPGGPRNLQARELDAAAGFARVRERYRPIDALFDRFSRNSAFDAGQDLRVMQDLIDLAPPGIDELAAVIEVIDAVDEGGSGRPRDSGHGAQRPRPAPAGNAGARSGMGARPDGDPAEVSAGRRRGRAGRPPRQALPGSRTAAHAPVRSARRRTSLSSRGPRRCRAPNRTGS